MRMRFTQTKAFLETRLRAAGYAASTIRGYLYQLNVFERYLIMQGIEDVRQVDEAVIQGYAAYLLDYVPRYGKGKKQKRLDAASRAISLRCVRKLFTLLVREDIVFADPFRSMEPVRQKDKLPKNVLTAQEIERLFSCPDTGTYLGFRNRTVLEVLYGTGLRISELIGLDISDVDPGERVVYIRCGKGRKDRVVPCTEAALAYLREYVAKVRPVLCYLDYREQALFVTNTGKRLTACAFRKMLAKYVKQSGIKKTVTAHSFRHTFATHLLEAGVNIRYIQEMLGHEKVSTTVIYTRVAVPELKKVMAQYHPRENELFPQGEEVQEPTEYHYSRKY